MLYRRQAERVLGLQGEGWGAAGRRLVKMLKALLALLALPLTLMTRSLSLGQSSQHSTKKKDGCV